MGMIMILFLLRPDDRVEAAQIVLLEEWPDTMNKFKAAAAPLYEYAEYRKTQRTAGFNYVQVDAVEIK